MNNLRYDQSPLEWRKELTALSVQIYALGLKSTKEESIKLAFEMIKQAEMFLEVADVTKFEQP